jgi:hypothetical protein
MTDAPPVLLRRGREGGRWINERPTPAEFSEWFTSSMKLDKSLSHEDYIGGVVLIPALDTKAKFVTGFTDKGLPLVEEREELAYIPYAKVETRTAYFWDLLDAHEDWLGVVERVTPPRMPIDFVHTEEDVQAGLSESGQPQMQPLHRKLRTPGALALLTHQLPDGFSITSVPVGTGYSHFICCTIRVSIVSKDGAVLRTGVATKQVPLLMGRSQPYADPSSLMKAETGALGRALGFAGIFVIPGSGVATAEDMLEAAAQGPTAATTAEPAENPTVPPAAPVRSGAEQAADVEAELHKRASTLYQALSESHPDRAESFGQWAKTRKLTSLGDAKGAMLRGVVRKLERLSDNATATEEAASDVPAEEASDVPAVDEPH